MELITTLALMSLMSNNLMLDYQELRRHLDVIQLYQGKVMQIKHFACEGVFQALNYQYTIHYLGQKSASVLKQLL